MGRLDGRGANNALGTRALAAAPQPCGPSQRPPILCALAGEVRGGWRGLAGVLKSAWAQMVSEAKEAELRGASSGAALTGITPYGARATASSVCTILLHQ